jgi:hypothetical protein
MQRVQTLVWVGLGLILVAGCAGGTGPRPPAWTERFQSFWSDPEPGTLQMEVAQIRLPQSDPYLSQGLWHELDEQCVPLDRRTALTANGLRVGVLGGTVPAGLQRLLTTPDGPCQAKRYLVRKGRPAYVPLGPVGRDLGFTLVEGAQERRQTFTDAGCGLGLTLTAGDGGDTVLAFEPRVRHGDKQRVARPTGDARGFSITADQPEERYPTAGGELTLTPKDYVVLAGCPERPGTWGHACFFDQEAGTQLVVVIRTARAALDQTLGGTAGPVPLAVQSLAPAKPSPGTHRGRLGEEP